MIALKSSKVLSCFMRFAQDGAFFGDDYIRWLKIEG
jgi:hypothetical protein